MAGTDRDVSAGPVGGRSKDPEAGGSAAGNPAGVFGLLDRILRQRESFFEEIFTGDQVGRWVKWFLGVIVCLSAFYGASMGIVGFTGGFGKGVLQMLSSAIKVPILYLMSLAVCFPVLYVVLSLMGARLRFSQTLAMILLALTLNTVLLSSCAPIVFFFALTSASYSFMKLLHVAIFLFSGAYSMYALWQGLRVMCEKSDLYPRQAVRILQVWMLVFGFVGTQMAWTLRPFVGSPGLEFQLLRSGQQGNFYQMVWGSLKGMAEDPSSTDEPYKESDQEPAGG